MCSFRRGTRNFFLLFADAKLLHIRERERNLLHPRTSWRHRLFPGDLDRLDRFKFWGWNVKDPPHPQKREIHRNPHFPPKSELTFQKICTFQLIAAGVDVLYEISRNFVNFRKFFIKIFPSTKNLTQELQKFDKIPARVANVFDENILTCWVLRCAEVCITCRSRKMLQDEYLVVFSNYYLPFTSKIRTRYGGERASQNFGVFNTPTSAFEPI